MENKTKSLIGNRDTEAVVYHNLRVLLEETDMGKFENLLHKQFSS